jgi:Prokaryotic dksA/traR C4-type zinc finger
MDNTSHPRAIYLREQALRMIHEDNERMAQQAAIDRCDKCPEPKRQDNHQVTLSNGISLATYSHHCGQKNADCTALVQAYLLNQPAEVSNRIIEWLVEQPELKAAGVQWMGCLAIGADRLCLAYRVHEAGVVASAVAALRVEEFQQAPVGHPCDRCGKPIPLHRISSIPNAIRCWDCQTEVERLKEQEGESTVRG